MKKLLLLLSIITILSCSSSDDNSDNSNSSNSITPPAWIQGTWLQVVSTNPYMAQPLFRFKTNDFCTLLSLIESCEAETIQQSAKAGAKTKIEQVITENEYKLSITISSLTRTYDFIKVNNSKIELVSTTVGLPNTPLIKQ